MTEKKSSVVTIIGGGLAGCEAAWQIANRGGYVRLYEMRPTVKTPVHQSENLAELVCSNSFRSDDHEHNAVGVLHEEMRRLSSLIMDAGTHARLPAGSALAVDRDIFSAYVTEKISQHPRIEIIREEVDDLSQYQGSTEPVIIATGPLTSDLLSTSILKLTGVDKLAFFDAIAPIVYHHSIDMNVVWAQSRYDKGDGKDYLNCPMSEQDYTAFIEAIIAADKNDFKDWEKDTPYFEGCLPIEVMASRGPETLRFGPMKPVGLTDPRLGEGAPRPYAVVQLRRDNKQGSLWNIVGFQTKMSYGDQIEVFRKIPGLAHAEFARLGGIHRNTFIQSPLLLDQGLRLKSAPNIRFAGQIMGVEGYIESAAMGLISGLVALADTRDIALELPNSLTAHGALLHHVTSHAESDLFQPMNINFGLMDQITPAEIKAAGKKRIKGRERKQFYAARALATMDQWISELNQTLPII